MTGFYTGKPNLRRLVAAAIVLFTMICEAAAAVCSVEEVAGKPAKSRVTAPDKKAFRIFWHIATQIETLADAGGNPKLLAAIAGQQARVDGYYFNVLSGGHSAYWPGRPASCAINFGHLKLKKEFGTLELPSGPVKLEPGQPDAEANCKTLQQASLKGSADQIPIQHRRALRRVIRNMNIGKEQQRGKTVMGEMLLVNADFAPASGGDALKLQRLPRTYCLLNSAGIRPDDALIYQEPAVQIPHGRFLALPALLPSGAIVNNPKQGRLPNNPYGFDLVGAAFAEAHVPLPRFFPNIRRWVPKNIDPIYARLASSKYAGGFVFEGAAKNFPDDQPIVNNFALGAAWILQNTSQDVMFLMPAYWSSSQVKSEAGIDELITGLDNFVRTLNLQIGAAMGLPADQNAVCTSHLVFIPASYGVPLVPETFPARRADGHLAGTVTGEIELLNKLRSELCGKLN